HYMETEIVFPNIQRSFFELTRNSYKILWHTYQTRVFFANFHGIKNEIPVEVRCKLLQGSSVVFIVHLVRISLLYKSHLRLSQFSCKGRYILCTFLGDRFFQTREFTNVYMIFLVCLTDCTFSFFLIEILISIWHP